MSIRAKAAVLRTAAAPRPYAGSRPLSIEEVVLAPPKPVELLVKIAGAGLCHSDLSVINGDRPRPLPLVLGHEGSGEVVEVGSAIDDVRPGDQVVFQFSASCGRCRRCVEGRPQVCERAARAKAAGELMAGGSRITAVNGEPAAPAADDKGFQPYVPDEVRMPEFTWQSVVTGTCLGLIFSASSLYLVLKVGMTVSASIPVAVLAITLFRVFSKMLRLRPATILENNIVQTAGSAGESIAFGLGVTLPAVMILGFSLEIWRIMLVGVMGGLLGILMMIPLRRALIVQQHGILKYPEGTACAEVLKAGASEESRAHASEAAKAEEAAALAAGLKAGTSARRTAPGCPASSTSTGSARTRTASSCGRGSARTRGCSSGSSAGSTARPRRASRPPAGSPAPRTSTRPGSTSRRRSCRRCCRSTRTACARSSSRCAATWRSSATACQPSSGISTPRSAAASASRLRPPNIPGARTTRSWPERRTAPAISLAV